MEGNCRIYRRDHIQFHGLHFAHQQNNESGVPIHFPCDVGARVRISFWCTNWKSFDGGVAWIHFSNQSACDRLKLPRRWRVGGDGRNTNFRGSSKGAIPLSFLLKPCLMILFIGYCQILYLYRFLCWNLGMKEQRRSFHFDDDVFIKSDLYVPTPLNRVMSS